VYPGPTVVLAVVDEAALEGGYVAKNAGRVKIGVDVSLNEGSSFPIPSVFVHFWWETHGIHHFLGRICNYETRHVFQRNKKFV
jgi:hypothetical protein